MDGGFPGRRQGGGEEGRSLRIGKKTGSSDGGTIAEGPKGQGIKLRKQPTVPTKPALGTEGTGTKDYGIRTQHEGSRTHGAGQNHRTNPTKHLVAKDERTNHRLCQKLPQMPTEQSVPAPTLWAVLPTRIALRPVAIHSNGLHHGTPNLVRL